MDQSMIVLRSSPAASTNATLTTTKPTDGSFTTGSTMSADSFIRPEGCDSLNASADDRSIDPYLDTNGPSKHQPRRRRRSSNYGAGKQDCIVTVRTNEDTIITAPTMPGPPSVRARSVVAATNSSSPQHENSSNSIGAFDFPPDVTLPQRSHRSHDPALLPPSTPISTTPQREHVNEEDDQQHEDNHRRSHTEQQNSAVHRLRTYWNTIVTARLMTYGTIHVRTAEALMQLGTAHMQGLEYSEAICAFKSACRIYRKIYGNDHLAVAHSLDKIGLASCKKNKEQKENLQTAMEALNKAFSIRYAKLGPSHVDTVDTLNNIAGVHLHLRQYSAASKAYYEVFVMRRAIFGRHHPSVAITAHSLGNVLVRLSSPEDARRYYMFALDICHRMNLPSTNPTVAKLHRDIKRLDRLARTSEYRLCAL